MKKAALAGGAIATAIVAVAVANSFRALVQRGEPISVARSPASRAGAESAEDHQGFLYGRVTEHDGSVYEGRLRFGGGEEAFWGDLFHSVPLENPWAAHVPRERLEERLPVEILGLQVGWKTREIVLTRPFVARFGDLVRLEASGRRVRVMLKSGSVVEFDRFEASDFDDGVRVWDVDRGEVELDSTGIHAIDFLPTGALGGAPSRLHGTVRTRQGEFTGFLRWGRRAATGEEGLRGRGADGRTAVRFDAVRAVARGPGEGALVTLADGREIVFTEPPGVAEGARGIAVDDPRFGRVCVGWEAFERADFGDPGAVGSGPAYGDFPPGRPLAGAVTTRTGRSLAGRLVFDVDESETTDALDGSIGGVDYSIPFGLVAAVVSGGGGASVTLHTGETLELESAGDLGERNAGVLVFAAGAERAEHVPWSDVERIDFDRPQDPPAVLVLP